VISIDAPFIVAPAAGCAITRRVASILWLPATTPSPYAASVSQSRIEN
jgi:hypothetical protein